MGKIKESRQTVYTTSDEKTFTDKSEARKHQMNISEKELTPALIEFLEKMYNLPSNEAINERYDSEEDGAYKEGERMEEKLQDFLNDQCDEMGWVDDMEDLASYLIGAYQAFGVEDMQEIAMFIDKKLGM